MERPSFTEAVRQELARLPLGSAGVVRAELAAIIRLAGSWQLGGGDRGHRLEVVSTSGAVA
jgi:DNA-binding transcriptional regulator WhiA